jgi:hypothetical protein
MSASVIVLATAFYVDNGQKLASQVPTLVYWLGPSVVGIPLLVRAFVRHSRVMADHQAAAHVMGAVHSRWLKRPTNVLRGEGHG